MSDIVKNTVGAAIDTADFASTAALNAVESAAELAGHGVEGVTRIGTKTIATVLAEAQALKKEFMDKVRELADTVTEPLP